MEDFSISTALVRRKKLRWSTFLATFFLLFWLLQMVMIENPQGVLAEGESVATPIKVTSEGFITPDGNFYSTTTGTDCTVSATGEKTTGCNSIAPLALTDKYVEINGNFTVVVWGSQRFNGLVLKKNAKLTSAPLLNISTATTINFGGADQKLSYPANYIPGYKIDSATEIDFDTVTNEVKDAGLLKKIDLIVNNTLSLESGASIDTNGRGIPGKNISGYIWQQTDDRGADGGSVHIQADKLVLDATAVISTNGYSGIGITDGGDGGSMLLQSNSYVFPANFAPGPNVNGGNGSDTAHNGANGTPYLEVSVPNYILAIGGDTGGSFTGGKGGQISVEQTVSKIDQPLITKKLTPIKRDGLDQVQAGDCDLKSINPLSPDYGKPMSDRCFNPYATKLGDQILITIVFSGIPTGNSEPVKISDTLLHLSADEISCKNPTNTSGVMSLDGKSISWSVPIGQSFGTYQYQCTISK
ncbi:MAG: hypothetical protein NTW50_02760 [Candidatus Berkelbacteria bacterium]|nr:hypothetical protein [Candidatus Berkelbacteria bacterium]